MTRPAECGATLVEMVVVVALLAMLLTAGLGFARNAPSAANHSVAERDATAILERVRSLAASNGATLSIAPGGPGSTAQLFAGWTTDPPALVDQLATAETVALSVNGTAHTTALISVRRDGSWTATVDGGAPVDCSASLRFGAVIARGASAGNPSPDAVVVTCAELAG